ncbi:MAG: plasmid maintenance system antidote protein [Bacteroidetes bacterium]|nr:plasmid maintenance system antidote protein [Bacteroidota bacterium]
MNESISIIKGVHPGYILERELKRRKLRKGPFALSLNEFPQTLVSITKGKRRMNTALAMKIENALELEEGFFMVLQAYFDIENEKRKVFCKHPDLTKLRPVLFWDTRIENINWILQKKAVITRVFERGNESEKNEMIGFYGSDIVNQILKSFE